MDTIYVYHDNPLRTARPKHLFLSTVHLLYVHLPAVVHPQEHLQVHHMSQIKIQSLSAHLVTLKLKEFWKVVSQREKNYWGWNYISVYKTVLFL